MSGVRLEHNAEIIPRGSQLKPLRDRLIVKPLDWQPSKIIAIAGSKRKTLRGEVVAVGPGTYLRHYRKNTAGERASYKDTRFRVPMEVKVGDIIELGGLEIDGYGFPEVLIGTEKHLICQQQDVVGIHA